MVERQAPLDVAVLCEGVDGLVRAVVGKQCWHVALQTIRHNGSCSSTGGSQQADVHLGALHESMSDILPADCREDLTSQGPSQASCNSARETLWLVEATREFWQMSARCEPVDCDSGACLNKSLACQTRGLTMAGTVLAGHVGTSICSLLPVHACQSGAFQDLVAPFGHPPFL